jgi:hypothetical protein
MSTANWTLAQVLAQLKSGSLRAPARAACGKAPQP